MLFNVLVGTSEGCLWSLRGKVGKFQALHPWCGRSKPLKPDLQGIWSETHTPRQYVFWASWVHCHVTSDIWKVKPGEGFASLRPVLGSAMLIGAGVAGYARQGFHLIELNQQSPLPGHLRPGKWDIPCYFRHTCLVRANLRSALCLASSHHLTPISCYR